MPNNCKPSATMHVSAYPPGEVHPLLAYAFRPVFLLLAAYMALSIILWGLLWTGFIRLSFIQDPLTWHIYEMLFGVASAGIIGFILTAIPEFYSGVRPVTGKPLLAIVGLWLLGRVSFWLIDILGVYLVALIHLPLLLWVIVLVAKPIFSDPQKRNYSLALTMAAILLIQGWFFAAQVGWSSASGMAILLVALGAFMVLILLALRRINTESINEWLDDHGIDETYIARPPRYNVAILCIILFTAVEFLMPGNPILGWLALATCAAVLNTLNDFFLEDVNIVFRAYILPLFLVLVLMATGYGLMGIDYLNDDIYGINHFRHFLTTGVFGLTFMLVMVIVGRVHTGRKLEPNVWISLSFSLLILATLLRGLIPFFPEYSQWMYLSSAIVWAAPFLIYLVLFYPILSSPRADGLPG